MIKSEPRANGSPDSRYAAVLAGVFCLAVTAPASAAEIPFDIIYCDAGTVNMIYDTKELKVFALTGKGITVSQHENKALNNASFSFIGNYTLVGGVRTGTGSMSFKDADGDMLLWEFEIGAKDKKYRFHTGTGKWATVKGSGTGVGLAVGRFEPGTFQSCSRVTGSFSAGM